MSENGIEIVYPGGSKSRGMPKEAELRQVIAAVCVTVGFETKRVKFCPHSIMRKNPHGASFKLQSVKQEDRFAVSVEIAGKKAVAIGHLFYIDEDGTPMGGQAMYDHIFASLGDSRVFKLSEFDNASMEASEQQTQPNSESLDIDDQQNEASEALGDGVKSNATSEDEVRDTDATVPDSIRATNSMDNYQGFFKDRNRLQLAIIALCTRFGPPSLFSFNDFIQTLRDEIGIRCDQMGMQPFLASFRNVGYINRINPGVTPARYSMTESAVAFAAETLPNNQCDKPVVTRRNSNTGTTGSGVIKHTSPIDTIVYLKGREEFSKKLRAEIESLKIQDVQVIDTLKIERQSLEHEAGLLREKLLSITSRLTEIDELQNKRDRESQKVADLETQLSDPTLKEELNELAKIRAMLGG